MPATRQPDRAAQPGPWAQPAPPALFEHPSPAPALLLAAGRGERMRPLTDTCPKPLLRVQGRPLLGWWLLALARAGVRRAVLNTAWLGEQIEQYFGPQFEPQFGLQGTSDLPSQLSNLEQIVTLSYSPEGRDFGHALETAGGIARALPALLGAEQAPSDSVFWLAAGDVFMPGFAFHAPAALQRLRAGRALAHLWLVANPAHHPGGDFGWDAARGLAIDLPMGHPERRWTYSSVALLHRDLFALPWSPLTWGNPKGQVAPLAPLLRAAMAAGQVSAELWPGAWTDVGTPERLAALQTSAPGADSSLHLAPACCAAGSPKPAPEPAQTPPVPPPAAF